MKVLKFQLPRRPDTQFIEMPEIRNITAFGTQDDKPVFWAMCYAPDKYAKYYKVVTIHTGDNIPYSPVHNLFGTTIHDEGNYILHHFIIEATIEEISNLKIT